MPDRSFAYRFKEEDNETYFEFPQFPEIVSAIPTKELQAMSKDAIQAWVTDAVAVTLEGYRLMKRDLPKDDVPETFQADGFVVVSFDSDLTLSKSGKVVFNHAALRLGPSI